MSQTQKSQTKFEEALDKIVLATWNRPRTNEELRDFVRRHHDELVAVDL